MKDTPKTIRSFIAIELSEKARTELARLQSRLKEASPPQKTVRWTDPKNVHLTLHFLGDLPEGRLEDVRRTLRDTAAAHTPFALNLANLGCFPNTRRPRIVWVGLTGNTDSLVAFQHELGESLKQAIGFQPESRKYAPHLTIGRVKKGVSSNALRKLGQSLEREIPGVGHLVALPVDHVHFIRSDLKPDGPVYTTLTQAEFGPPS